MAEIREKLIKVTKKVNLQIDVPLMKKRDIRKVASVPPVAVSIYMYHIHVPGNFRGEKRVKENFAILPPSVKTLFHGLYVESTIMVGPSPHFPLIGNQLQFSLQNAIHVYIYTCTCIFACS